MRELLLITALFAPVAQAAPFVCNPNRDVTPPNAPPADPTPEEAIPGEMVEHDGIPSGEDLIRSLWQKARENCRPAGVKVAPPGVYKFSVGIVRSPADDFGAAGERATWSPTLGVARRF